MLSTSSLRRFPSVGLGSNTASIFRIQRLATTTTTHATPSSTVSMFVNWHRWGRVLRYTRIPLLVVSVYGIGYQQGIMDTTRMPWAMQQGLLLTLLKSVGVTRDDQVQLFHNTTSSTSLTAEQQMVRIVGQQILQAARDYVQEQLQDVLQQAQQENDTVPSDMTTEQQLEYFMTQSKYAETIQLWYNAQLRLHGEDGRMMSNQEWSYVWIHSSNVPNAFVTEILPRRIFITSAMGRIAQTPDEWAVVLGHELSHLLLGHNSQSNQLELFLKTVEVLLLSLDPTEGFLSVVVVGALAALHKGLAAAYSREHERQADELGLVLAARACFDTQRGVHVMHKMHQHSVSAAPSTTTLSLWDTHPPSLERFQQLQVASQLEHPARYQHCQTMTQRFWRAMRSPKSSE